MTMSGFSGVGEELTLWEPGFWFVRLAFRNHTERLLVYDVPDRWGPLCRFLGVGEPGRAVPYLNKGATK